LAFVFTKFINFCKTTASNENTKNWAQTARMTTQQSKEQQNKEHKEYEKQEKEHIEEKTIPSAKRILLNISNESMKN
jgi:hypothetical protein